MSETTSNPENMEVWSVADILKNYPRLGIPHFQRGSVWNDENIAALLESLFYNTPCGSIVLWPNSDQNNGKPFGAEFKNLIIDGQQRITNLYSVFAKDTADGASGTDREGNEQGEEMETEGGEDTTIPYVWAINLYKLRDELEELKGIAFKEKTRPRYQNLFAKIQDPEKKKAAKMKKLEEKKAVEIQEPKKKKSGNGENFEYPYQYDFFPLKYRGLEENFEICFPGEHCEDQPCVFVDVKNPDPGMKGKIKKAITEVMKRLKGLEKSNIFTVYSLPENASLNDVIHTFIRINSGGRPVQSEEKAFSRLVQLCPADPKKELSGTADSVRQIFDWIRNMENGPKATPKEAKKPACNDFLQRMQERQFGFRLFIRVFILAMNYHMGKAIGTTGLSFSVIQGEAEKLQNKEEKLRELWETTSRVVIAVRRLLLNQLHLDTLAFLPDSRSLLPVFMLLIKHPDFMEGEGENCKIKTDYQWHFAYILLTILLAETSKNEGDIMKLTTLLREVPLTGEKTLNLLINVETDQKLDEWCPAEFKDSEAMKRCRNLKKMWDNVVQNAKDLKDIIDAEKTKEKGILQYKKKGKLFYANALNNRYVLLLYALERSLGVRDFYGDCLPQRQEEFAGKPQNILGRRDNPEKQHIVPYSAFSIKKEKKGRVATSPVNNIGNLTYISMRQNREDLGTLWLRLSKLDADLKRGHIIEGKNDAGDNVEEDAITLYYKIGDLTGNSDWTGIDDARLTKIDDARLTKAETTNDFNLSPDDKQFQNWIARRRSDIADAFSAWLEDMRKNANAKELNAAVVHASALLLADEYKKAADSAFLPQLWSLDCRDKDNGYERRQYLSWLAWNPGSAIDVKNNTLYFRPKSAHKLGQRRKDQAIVLIPCDNDNWETVKDTLKKAFGMEVEEK